MTEKCKAASHTHLTEPWSKVHNPLQLPPRTRALTEPLACPIFSTGASLALPWEPGNPTVAVLGLRSVGLTVFYSRFPDEENRGPLSTPSLEFSQPCLFSRRSRQMCLSLNQAIKVREKEDYYPEYCS